MNFDAKWKSWRRRIWTLSPTGLEELFNNSYKFVNLHKNHKKNLKILQFEKPKLPKLNHFITFIRKKVICLLIFPSWHKMCVWNLQVCKKKINKMILMSENKDCHFFTSFLCIRATKLHISGKLKNFTLTLIFAHLL